MTSAFRFQFSCSAVFRLVQRALGRVRRELIFAASRLRYRRYPSYILGDGTASPILEKYFAFIDRKFVSSLGSDFPAYCELLRQQTAETLTHRFDLLGSGPTIVVHGVNCRGVDGISYAMSKPVEADRAGQWLKQRINRANLVEAQRIWTLVDEGYAPIDWQLDFKSGYRWSEDCWYRDVRFGHLPGVDVKVPWELARLQHLPTLALACHFGAAWQGGFSEPGHYAREFRNQVLDFVATNPPGFGVNWACPMDVAIRAANLLVARDVVRAAGINFDDAFEAVFAASVLAHGRHLVSNLEWSPRYRGNHYLADVVGLLFIAAYLQCSEEVDAWLAFAVQELLTEVEYQFHEDGSNFEGSVCYHRLSAEMVLWAFALLSSLQPRKRAVLQRGHHHRTLPRLRSQPFHFCSVPGGRKSSAVPEWAWQRLGKIAAFTLAMTRPDGLVVQFGDNDSGRFFVFGSGEQLRADNDPSAVAWSLDHGSLVAGIEALVGTPADATVSDDPAARIVWAFADFGGVRSGSGAIRTVALGGPAARTGDDRAWHYCTGLQGTTAAASKFTTRFHARPAAAQSSLLAGLERLAFTGMGCYIFRSPRLYLAIRCGEIGLAGLGAHAHCDQLGIELVVDGKSLLRDPGTYLYTPLPALRNAYRSATVHHVPRVAGREPGDLGQGMFNLHGLANGECLYFGPFGFVGRHAGYGPWVYRQIVVAEDEVIVHDYADGDLVLIDPVPNPICFSPGYGRREFLR